MRRCGISRVPVAARRRGGGARREPLQSALCRRLNVCQELMSYTANVGRQRTEFQNGVCCWVLAAGADARNLPRELLGRQATQRMRLHRTTTSHHPARGRGRQMQWSFFSPTTGEAYTPPIRTRLATSSRSDRPAPAAETCRACAVLGIMSRHVTSRRAAPFQGFSVHPSIQP